MGGPWDGTGQGTGQQQRAQAPGPEGQGSRPTPPPTNRANLVSDFTLKPQLPPLEIGPRGPGASPLREDGSRSGHCGYLASIPCGAHGWQSLERPEET